jgi:beta-lactamase superfamily II metal-dependent hydrolase
MRAALVFLWCLGLAAAAVLAQAGGARTLDIYYIDTEGGQSTLFVSPTGESLLVDTGNPGDRDVPRIVEALAAANVTQIDHLWTTHYHVDHVGGLQQLAGRVPIRHFYDHGLNVEPREQVAGFASMYEELTKGKRTSLKPGDTLRMAGLEITTVASAGQVLGTNLTGGGRANPACAGVKPKDESPTDDNGQSAGFVLTYGKFRTIDLGDLLWNRELELMCPTNRIGTVDVYLTSHHGLSQSGSRALVHGLAPRVAIMNNGTRKGGSLDAFQTVHTSPGLEDLWQLHWSHNVGLDHNAPGVFIANVEANDTVAGILTAQAPAARGGAAHVPAYWIKVSARPDGAFSVTNARNGFSKSYRPR